MFDQMNNLYDFFNCWFHEIFYFLLLGRSYSHKSQFLVFAQNPVGLSQGVTISASLIIGMKQGGINQNFHWKLGQQTLSAGTLLVYLGTTKSIRQQIEKMEIKIVWMSWLSWNFVKLVFKQMLKVSAFYLKKQKVVFLKEIYFMQ